MSTSDCSAVQSWLASSAHPLLCVVHLPLGGSDQFLAAATLTFITHSQRICFISYGFLTYWGITNLLAASRTSRQARSGRTKWVVAIAKILVLHAANRQFRVVAANVVIGHDAAPQLRLRTTHFTPIFSTGNLWQMHCGRRTNRPRHKLLARIDERCPLSAFSRSQNTTILLFPCRFLRLKNRRPGDNGCHPAATRTVLYCYSWRRSWACHSPYVVLHIACLVCAS